MHMLHPDKKTSVEPFLAVSSKPKLIFCGSETFVYIYAVLSKVTCNAFNAFNSSGMTLLAQFSTVWAVWRFLNKHFMHQQCSDLKLNPLFLSTTSA